MGQAYTGWHSKINDMSKQKEIMPSELKEGDKFVWAATNRRGKGLVYYIVESVQEGMPYVYPEREKPYHKAKRCSMTDAVILF